jgi:uncharacterized Ntn-hydrolase superfamily protein
MIRYLLDTGVTSQAGKRKPNKNALKWLASVNDDELAIGVITLRERLEGANVLSKWNPFAELQTRLQMTWSILARDRSTGALGAAVATRFFAVGALAIHVEGGVAALATQALINPMYAVLGMPRLRANEPPDSVVEALLAADAGQAHRQIHVLDAGGRIAVHTGPECVGWCGSVRAADVSIAGNMLAGPDVVAATLAAFEAAAGSMAERLLTALEAGEAAGGDKRGKQSAALKVCTRDPYPDLDIRADDHPDPLAELRRLHAVSQERFALFRRFLPGADSPCGVFDRVVIELAISARGTPQQCKDVGLGARRPPGEKPAQQ